MGSKTGEKCNHYCKAGVMPTKEEFGVDTLNGLTGEAVACGAGNCSVVFNDTIAFGSDVIPVAWLSSVAAGVVVENSRRLGMVVDSMADFERVVEGDHSIHDVDDDWDMDDAVSIELEKQLEEDDIYRDPSFLQLQAKEKRRLEAEKQKQERNYMQSPAYKSSESSETTRQLSTVPSYYTDPPLSCICQPNWYGTKVVDKPAGQVNPKTQHQMCFKSCGCDFARGGTDKCFDGPDGSGVCQCKEHFINDDCGQCEPNYYGPLCQTHCIASSKCNDRGSCNSNTGECTCQGSWSGPHCTCPGCSGHGSCTGGANSTCACSDGYLGDNCQYAPASVDATHWYVEASGNDTAVDWDACVYPNAKCGSGTRYKKVICMQQYVEKDTGVQITKVVADVYCAQAITDWRSSIMLNPNGTYASLTNDEYKVQVMKYPSPRTEMGCAPTSSMQTVCDCPTYPLGLVEIANMKYTCGPVNQGQSCSIECNAGYTNYGKWYCVDGLYDTAR